MCGARAPGMLPLRSAGGLANHRKSGYINRSEALRRPTVVPGKRHGASPEMRGIVGITLDSDSYRAQSGICNSGSAPPAEGRNRLIFHTCSTPGEPFCGRPALFAPDIRPARREALPASRIPGPARPRNRLSEEAAPTVSNGPPGERRRRGRGRRPRPSPGRRNAAHGGPCAALSDGRGSGRAARRRDPAADRPAARPGTIPPGGARAGASRRPGFFRLSGCRRLVHSSPGSTRLHWGASEEDALRSQVGTRSLATRRIFQWGPLEMVIDPPRPGAHRPPAEPAQTGHRACRPAFSWSAPRD